MIIEEKNQEEERRKEIQKIKSLWDIELPKKYVLEDYDGNGSLEIRHVSWFEHLEVAKVRIDEDVITISFKCGEDYKKLRKYFENSKTKFKLDVGEGYYY